MGMPACRQIPVWDRASGEARDRARSARLARRGSEGAAGREGRNGACLQANPHLGQSIGRSP